MPRSSPSSPPKSGSNGSGGRRSGRGGPPPAPPAPIPEASLADEAQRRYLNYALSVITARALPDVRDGLKPVQRRILFAMLKNLGLRPDGRFRKSAAVVGEVMKSYHPHGDSAIYDAMVRLAQDWVLRAPLVAGYGNFGSLDGDAPAAMRYTEAKLRPLAMELLGELGQSTVDWRPNYDGSESEPVVLPSRFPNLLVNGSQGIAVGMATSIPPHNLGEVVDAAVALVEQPDLPPQKLLSHVKGPDFPTAGLLQASKRDLETLYVSGQGSLKLRGEYKVEEGGKGGGASLVVTSIPYGVERKAIVEKIAEVILSKKMPSIIDVRDESTDKVRVVVELKKGADPQLAVAYLYKNTPLQSHVQVNLTCLVPTPENPEVCAPRRLGLKEILQHFLDFRFETVTRRLRHELGLLEKRIHLLEGLEKVFDALDELIRIIRKSEGKADAAQKIIARFKLSEEQTDAILELKLYKLARLEILLVQKELGEKRAEQKKIESLLKSDAKRWGLVKAELLEIKEKYADKRRTRVLGSASEPEFQAEDFILAEDVSVILSAQGWVKRVREVKDLGATRLRDGDSVLAAVSGSTRASVAFFSNFGAAYVCRIHDVPASTGYGDPVQKLFKLADGERMMACLSFDPRALAVPEPTEGAPPEPPYALAVTRSGQACRFSLRPHREPSTRAGRKYMKLLEGDEVVAITPVSGADAVLMATTDGYALGVLAEEVPVLSGAGKGATIMRVSEGERILGAVLALSPRDVLTIETEKGKTQDLSRSRILGQRGDRGEQIFKSVRVARVVSPPPVVPTLEVS